MKKPVHSIITVLLMLCFSISAIMYFFFDIAQFHDKAEAHNNLVAKQDLRLVKLPLKDFINYSDKDEVWDHGKLYDVSSYIIINDSACIWVFHDQQEERLINALVNSFEPNEQYNCDNTVHIIKHRIHTPGGKILVVPYAMKFMEKPVIHYALSGSIVYSLRVFLTVIKPPPRYMIA